MNSRLTAQLASFSGALESATTGEEIQAALVALEGTVLKSNIEEQSTASVEAREYLVGEANTRGLSWKLNLLRQVAAANFCQLVRVGVHGGNTKILGQPENIDITLAIYEALIPAYEALSSKAFTEFSDAQTKGEGEPTVHRVGWVNKFLIDAPDSAFGAVSGDRESAASGNRKASDTINEKSSAVATFKASLAPAKPAKEPKAPKAPKAKKSAPAEGEAATDSGSVAPQDIPNDAE